MLVAPPVGSLPPGNPKKICSRRTAFRIEAARSMPDLRECFLHDVFNRLFVGKLASEEGAQVRGVFSILHIESIRVAVRNPLPELVVV